MPASWIRTTNGAAEPSRIGISGPSTSTRQLSMPMPWSAAITCSTVATRVFPLPRLVERVVSTTCSLRAAISTPTSMRTKVMPASAGAGASVRVAGFPEWRPTPAQDTRFATVR